MGPPPSLLWAAALLLPAFSGCLGGDDGSASEGPGSRTPAGITPTKSVHGVLGGLAAENATTIFLVEASVLDCEAVDRVERIGADASRFIAPRPFVPETGDHFASSRYEYQQGTFVVSDKEALTPGTMYLFTVRGFDLSPERAPFEDRLLMVLDAPMLENGTLRLRHPDGADGLLHLGDPGDPNRREFIEARRPWLLSDLVVGRSYTLDFSRPDAGSPWRLDAIGEDEVRLRAACAERHVFDLRVTAHSGAVAFPPGTRVPLTVRLTNAQDHAIDAALDDASMVDLLVLKPYTQTCPEGRRTVQGPDGQREECVPMEFRDRLEAARVPGCAVDGPGTVSVPARGTAAFVVGVTCGDGIGPQEARTFWLWGSVEFIDELGNRHVVSSEPFYKVLGSFAPEQASEGAPDAP